MDEKISGLFREWLAAFERVQDTSVDDAKRRADTLREIETKLAAEPAEGFQGLAIKLALYCFLRNHEDTSSQAESAYRDLVRLTSNDPLAEIAARFEKSA
jgi:hypothetical protein